jgi:DNA-binding phage protein
MVKQYLLNEKEYIETFNNKHMELIKDYLKARKLIDKDKGITEIHMKTGISMNRLSNWTRKESKIPIALKSILKARNRGYFTIEKNSREVEILAYLVGYNMGDGNIHRALCNTWFYGHSDDLPTFNKLLKPFGIKGKIHIYKIHNGKMCVSDNSYTRFMVALECPIGDKTKSRFMVPKWILKSRKASEIKRKFLQGLCDSELSSLKLIFRNRLAFQSPKFYSVKMRDFEDDGKIYLDQLRGLFLEFNVLTGDVKVDRSYIRSRDNGRMIQLYFVVYSNYINLYNFISQIGFLYNKKRKEQVKKYYNKIKLMAKKELDKLIKYEKAIVLRKKGMSAYKISEKLDLPIHNAKSWLYRGMKPMKRNYKISN